VLTFRRRHPRLFGLLFARAEVSDRFFSLIIGGAASAAIADVPLTRVPVDNPRARIQQFEIIDDGRITGIALVS
jgi:hypothetical protein